MFHGSEWRQDVSILTDSWESVQHTHPEAQVTLLAFQSSPTPGSRCNILLTERDVVAGEFQSSPTPGSRCNLLASNTISSNKAGFNPHRLLGVGATGWGVPRPDNQAVSILTDSWESVQLTTWEHIVYWCRFQSSPTPGSRCNLHIFGHAPLARLVSILTDSWESVQRSGDTSPRTYFPRFQSSPTPGSRCNLRGQERRSATCGFNPHRLLGAGAT